MRENYRNSIASIKKFPQFTIMNVINGQAGLIIYASLIFYSLTTDNILNIIVLLILAGISISMLAGNNGILLRAGEARDKTKEKQKDEEVKIAILGSYDDQANLDIDKLITNLNEIKDITITPSQENGTNTFPVVVETEYTTYEITGNGKLKEVVIADRTGINIGDYITYVSPTESVSFSTTETGYTNEQTLLAKSDFRVMNIDSYGNMILIGAMSSEDQTISIMGALGYNNAVYTLNKKCSDLYKDTSKGITARSIKVEDIKEKFSEIGKSKLTDYTSNQMSTLSTNTNVEKDINTNRVTFGNGNTNYPDLFQYEKGGVIDNVNTTGEVDQSKSYRGYGGITTLENKEPAPTRLTITYTYYKIKPELSDFKIQSTSEIYKNMLFESSYWVASRFINCGPNRVYFRLGFVANYTLDACSLYYSSNTAERNNFPVCPIVYIPSSVDVEVSENPKNQTNIEGTAHVVK